MLQYVGMSKYSPNSVLSTTKYKHYAVFLTAFVSMTFALCNNLGTSLDCETCSPKSQRDHKVFELLHTVALWYFSACITLIKHHRILIRSKFSQIAVFENAVKIISQIRCSNMPHPLLMSLWPARHIHMVVNTNHWLISHVHWPAASGEKLKSNAYLRGWSNGPWLPRLWRDLGCIISMKKLYVAKRAR